LGRVAVELGYGWLVSDLFGETGLVCGELAGGGIWEALRGRRFSFWLCIRCIRVESASLVLEALLGKCNAPSRRTCLSLNLGGMLLGRLDSIGAVEVGEVFLGPGLQFLVLD
jgi:hypothetical protein